MPSNLANLKIMPRFVVGTPKGSMLKELKHIMHLEGELFISKLQQDEVVGDAKDDDLSTEQDIDKLVLQWAQDFIGFRNEECENMVLDFMKPHVNIKVLKISYYGGMRIWSWLGSASYASIVHVDVCGCRNVTSLPSLGQLPSIKELHVEGLSSVRKVGNEFYGIEKLPFHSLRTLVFCEMSTWEDWSDYGGVYEVEPPFGCLEHLIIWHCPKLVGRLPEGFDSLTNLEIDSCPCLEESSCVISLPSLDKLHLKGSNVEMFKSLVDLTFLTALKITSIPKLTYFESRFINS